MRSFFVLARYIVVVAVVAMLIAALSVFMYGGITTVIVIVETFGHMEFSADNARLMSAEIIELIDLFFFGTVLLITSIGLYQLFVDPHIELPNWLAVHGLEKLKANLPAVIIVMLAVMFTGEEAGELGEHASLLEYGGAIAFVVAAVSLAVYVFSRVHHSENPVAHAEAKAQGDVVHTHLDESGPKA